MSIAELRWGLFWRMVRWGVLEGVILGAAYGAILLATGVLFGGLIGGGMGLLLGIATGAQLSDSTLEYYYPLEDFAEYRREMTIHSVALSSIGIVIMMAILTFLVFNAPTLGYLPFCVIVPAVIGGAAAALAIRRVTGWYQMNVDRVQPDPKPVDEWA